MGIPSTAAFVALTDHDPFRENDPSHGKQRLQQQQGNEAHGNEAIHADRPVPRRFKDAKPTQMVRELMEHLRGSYCWYRPEASGDTRYDEVDENQQGVRNDKIASLAFVERLSERCDGICSWFDAEPFGQPD